MDTRNTVATLGRRIRALREAQGLSLRDLAERAGVSSGAVQKIESGAMSPTISTLMKIARGLRCRVTEFLEEGKHEDDVVVTRRAERQQVSWGEGAVRVDYVSGDLPEQEHLLLEIHLAPGGSSGEDPLSHGGDEIALCATGQVEFEIGDRRVRLRRGDCLHFRSDLPHRWSNPGRTPARLWLVSSAGGPIHRLP